MLGIINIFLDIISALIVIRIVISWISPMMARNNEFVSFIFQITEPILAPFRFVLPIGRMGGLDLSPIVVFMLINLLRSFLNRLLM